MDPHGGIHTMPKEHDTFPVGGLPVRVDGLTIRKKFGPLVPIPNEMVEALRLCTRAARRGWYAEYRHRLKVAKKTGRPAIPPPVPALPMR